MTYRVLDPLTKQDHHMDGELRKLSGHEFFITSFGEGKILYLHDLKSGIPVVKANDRETLEKEGVELVKEHSSFLITKKTKAQCEHLGFGNDYPLNK